MRERIDRFDASVDRWFDRRVRVHGAADVVFYAASTVGDWAILWHLIGVSRGLIDHDRWADAARLSGTLAVESVLVNQGIKRLFRRTRPVHDGPRRFRLRTPRTTSFPSGHASAAFCAAVVLTDQQPSLAALWFALAVIVASSRIHVRIHHASDVVGGAIVGVVLGVVASTIFGLF